MWARKNNWAQAAGPVSGSQHSQNGGGYDQARANDHETYDPSTSLCVRALKHVRICIHKSSYLQVGRMNYGRSYGSYGRYNGGYGQYYGSPNNRGGLVGGSDAGTYRP